MNTLQISDYNCNTNIEIIIGSLAISQNYKDCDTEFVFLRNDELRELYRILRDYYGTNSNH